MAISNSKIHHLDAIRREETDESIVFVKDGKAVTDSLIVSRHFGKAHRNVVRDIRSLLKKIDPEWGLLNFEHTHYIHPQNHQTYEKYVVSEHGFALLMMGYTGDEATKFKLRFLKEFERMQMFIQLNVVKHHENRFAIEDIQSLVTVVVQNTVAEVIRALDLVPKSVVPPTIVGNQSSAFPVERNEVQQETVTPTDLGRKFNPPISPVVINRRLASMGLQEHSSNDNGTHCWCLTEKGREYGVETHYSVHGAPVRQVRWYPFVLRLLDFTLQP